MNRWLNLTFGKFNSTQSDHIHTICPSHQRAQSPVDMLEHAIVDSETRMDRPKSVIGVIKGVA